MSHDHEVKWCDHAFLIKNTTSYCCKDCGRAIVGIPKQVLQETKEYSKLPVSAPVQLNRQFGCTDDCSNPDCQGCAK